MNVSCGGCTANPVSASPVAMRSKWSRSCRAARASSLAGSSPARRAAARSAWPRMYAARRSRLAASVTMERRAFSWPTTSASGKAAVPQVWPQWSWVSMT